VPLPSVVSFTTKQALEINVYSAKKFCIVLRVLSEAHENLKRPDSALLTGILIVVVLYFAREVFVPLALAALIAFVLAPAANRLERFGMRRTPAALLVIVLSLATVAFLGWVLMGQIYSLAVELPQYQQNVTDKIGSLHLDSAGKLSRTVEMLDGLNKRLKSGNTATGPVVSVVQPQRRSGHSHANPVAIANKTPQPVSVRIEEPEESVLELAGRTMTPLVHPLTTTFIVVVFLVFLLIGREDLRDRGLKLAGSGRMHVTTSAIKDATARVSRYLQMQLVVNLCYGAVVGVALQLIGVPHPLLWAILTCVLRFVPYIGIMMAAAGPLVLAGAVSPHWTALMWTVIMFCVLEMVAGNFVEPMLYGASTGISAIAVLIAAVFWTFLWGLPGLLLSTPLTVCLIVIGRQVPRLHYLEVLLGERTGLPPSEHFYQRMLASNPRDARALVDTTLKTRTRAEVYDTVLVPALTMIGEARHSEEMTAARAEEVLQSVEELVEELNAGADSTSLRKPEPAKRVLCIPARDFADEIACQLAQQVLEESTAVQVVAADCSTASVQEHMDRLQPEVICVVGVPPRAVRNIRMRCHQIRARSPESVVVACVLSDADDLSSLRSRIPIEDAQHVVSSLQLMRDYLTSVLRPAEVLEAAVETEEAAETAKELDEVPLVDPFDGPVEGMFNRLATNLARSFDAPIVLITAVDGERHFWEAQCGLPEEALSTGGAERDGCVCNTIVSADQVVIIADIAEEERFAADPFLKAHGIRFCAVAPLKDQDQEVVGSLCVLDTRPRQITERQRETLISVAESVMMAIELREPIQTGEVAAPR
jgi:predicted PurR-regulated permease PerM/GAF domain-containing protein